MYLFGPSFLAFSLVFGGLQIFPFCRHLHLSELACDLKSQHLEILLDILIHCRVLEYQLEYAESIYCAKEHHLI
jgi:hypothetical protein